MPLQLPMTPISVTVPRGTVFRLDHVFVNYPRTVVGSTQTSPELLFVLKDSRNLEQGNVRLSMVDITTPSGGQAVAVSQSLGILYGSGEQLALEVYGMAAGPVPATVSVTYLGVQGWGRR